MKTLNQAITLILSLTIGALGLFFVKVALGATTSIHTKAAASSSMEPILEHYLKIQESLAKDSLEGVSSHAKAISMQSKKVDSKALGSQFKSLPADVSVAAKHLEESKDLKSAREAFKKLSQPLTIWAKAVKPQGVHIASCTMAKAGWLQRLQKIQNPYYGQEMLECGEFIK
jgi:Cu(I)/Ag(I) efflux system membrane fusion protein